MQGHCDVCEKPKETEHWKCCDADICADCAWNPATRVWAAGRRKTRQLRSTFAALLGRAS